MMIRLALTLLFSLVCLAGPVTAAGYRHTGIYPATPAPYPSAERARVHIEKDRYEQGYLLRVYTQGIKPEDIQIRMDHGVLRLRVQAGQQQAGSSFRSAFQRTVRLPRDSVPSQMTTSSEDGVLEIRIPRR